MFLTRDKVLVLAMLSLAMVLAIFTLLVFNQGVQGASIENNVTSAELAPVEVPSVEIPPVEVAPVEVSSYMILNPYAGVDWDNFGQFKTSLHNHTRNSDGLATTAELVERFYTMDYDIVAITDHNYLTARWSEVSTGAMTAGREAEILAGTDRGGRPLIPIPFSNEQSRGEHLNTYFVKFNNSREMELEDSLRINEEMGGISVIVHPGRYVGADASDYQSRAAAASNSYFVQRYSDIFMQFPSCIGMEIINTGADRYSHDRILWDNILMQTMPHNRPVWGFANDDAHSLEELGFAFNVLLIDREDFLLHGLNGLDARTAEELREQSTSNPVRDAMARGAFYAVSRVDRRENINIPELLTEDVLMNMLSQATPSINSISVDEQKATITISGANYDTVEWVADGIVISAGSTLDVAANSAHINSYVRAQLKGSYGIAFTQPFGIKRVD